MAKAPTHDQALPPDRVPPDRVLLGVAGCFGLGILLAVAYDTSDGAIAIPCPVRLTTGWDCPTCGATRMAAALLHGDVAAAMRLNPFVLLLGLVAGPLLIVWTLRRFGLSGLPAPRLDAGRTRFAAGVLLAIAVLFTVLRNLGG